MLALFGATAFCAAARAGRILVQARSTWHAANQFG
jgi:hypothetical protein